MSLVTLRIRRSAAVLLVATVSACGTGIGAQTNEIYTPATGINVRDGAVDALNTLVVANDDGSGTVSVALLNEAPEVDQLVRVDASSEGEDLAVDAVDLPLDLPAEQLVNLSGEAPVFIDQVRAGFFVRLRFTFTNGEPVETRVPVVERTAEGIYDTVPTAPARAFEATTP